MAERNPKRFRVYVIKLDAAVLASTKFRNANPQRVPNADCFYVGMTSCAPQKRFEQHKADYKACRFARDYGLELMPDRFSHCNPKSYDDAARFERKLAMRLRRKGHAVWQR